MQRVHKELACIEHRFVCVLLVTLISAGIVRAQERAYYGEGRGEPNDPYQIWTPEQFVAINAHSEDWGSCFRLMADVNLVDMDSELIAPIGNHKVPFSGVFDGNDFAIGNFVLHSDSLNDVGVFGVVSTQDMQDRIDPYGLGRHYKLYYETYEFDADVAVIHVQDLDIVNSDVRGKNNVGALAARCYGSMRRCDVTNATVVNSGTESDYLSGGGSGTRDDGVPIFEHIKGSVLSSSSMVGHLFIGNLVDCHVSSTAVEGVGMVAGLVGFAHDSRVTLCSVQGSVSGDYRTGGLVGYAVYTRVEQCRTEVSVSAVEVDISHGQNVGGLIGYASGSHFSECCALGQIEGTTLSQYLGGFVGESGSSSMTNCYSSCDVDSPFFRALGGFVGRSSEDVLKFCYSSGQAYFVPDPNWSIPEWVSLEHRASFVGERSFTVGLDLAAEACFWDMETSGIDVGVYYVMEYTDIDLPYEDIFRATTQEMWTQKTYADVEWDFEAVWAIEEGLGYPVLQWELSGDREGQ
jgi:hypothetical protein